jgi:hypothetical protein
MEEKTPKSFLKPKHTVPRANVSHMTEFKVRVEEHGTQRPVIWAFIGKQNIGLSCDIKLVSGFRCYV